MKKGTAKDAKSAKKRNDMNHDGTTGTTKNSGKEYLSEIFVVLTE